MAVEEEAEAVEEVVAAVAEALQEEEATLQSVEEDELNAALNDLFEVLL